MASTGQVQATATQIVAESPWLDETWVDGGGGAFSATAASFDSPDQTHVLKRYTYDFSVIPAGSTIDGVIVRVTARYAAGTASLDLIQLLNTSRAKVGTNKASTPSVLTTTNAVYTYGTSTDLWGNSLTEAWVKDPDFGVAVGALATAANADVFVSNITIEVFYTPPTVNTAYRVSFPTPTDPLEEGADLQEFRTRVYVDGAGSPTGELFLYENNVQIASLWSGTVTGTSASPTTLPPGLWDATGRTAANIEARFVGTGVAGGTARLHSIEWNAAVVPIDTAYHVSFPTPAGPLVEGADLQEFRAAIYMEGTGSPTGALYLYENGTEVTGVDNPIWSGTVTGTEADPQEVSGLWDATGRTASQIEAYFEGTGVVGGAAYLYAIEWNASTEESVGVELSGTLSGGGNYAGAAQVSRPLSGTLTSGGTYSGVLEVARRLSGTLSTGGSYTGAAVVSRRLSGTLSSGGTYTGAAQVSKLLSGTLSSGGTYAASLQVSKLLSGTLSSGGVYDGALAGAVVLSGTLSSGGQYVGVGQVSRLLSGTLSAGGNYAGEVEISRLLSGTLASGGVYAGVLHVPGTLDTDVRLTFASPPEDLVAGADLQEFRIEARKVGTGSDPLLTAYLYESGGGTPLAELLTDQPITDTTGQVFSATWDASLLADISGAGVELRVVISGNEDGYGELVNVEWNATHEAAAEVLLSGTLSGGGAYAGVVEVSKLLSGTVSSGGNYAGAIEVSKVLSGTVSSGGNYSGTPEVSRSLSAALGSGGQYSGTIVVSKLLSGAFSAGGVYQGVLEGDVLLSGTLSGGGNYVGVPLVSRRLSGTVGSGGVYSGQLAEVVAVLLSGTLAGGTNYAGTLLVSRRLSGILASGGTFDGAPEIGLEISLIITGRVAPKIYAEGAVTPKLTVEWEVAPKLSAEGEVAEKVYAEPTPVP